MAIMQQRNPETETPFQILKFKDKNSNLKLHVVILKLHFWNVLEQQYVHIDI